MSAADMTSCDGGRQAMTPKMGMPSPAPAAGKERAADGSAATANTVVNADQSTAATKQIDESSEESVTTLRLPSIVHDSERHPAASYGQATLDYAAKVGCHKCKQELETGEKTRKVHSDHCPRKWKRVGVPPKGVPYPNKEATPNTKEATPPTGDNCKPSDVFLNFERDPEYRAIMFARFKALGPGSKRDVPDTVANAVANDVLQMLKKRGGRIFKLLSPGSKNNYEETDDEGALKRIMSHLESRNKWYHKWGDDAVLTRDGVASVNYVQPRVRQKPERFRDTAQQEPESAPELEEAAPVPSRAREPSSHSELLRLVDRLFRDVTDKNAITVGDINRSVAAHYGWAADEFKKKGRKSMKKVIKVRLTALVTRKVQAGEGAEDEQLRSPCKPPPELEGHSSDEESQKCATKEESLSANSSTNAADSTADELKIRVRMLSRMPPSAQILPFRDGKPKPRKNRWMCGDCEACVRDDCGKCKNCLDMRKFGGKGTRKGKCLLRKCTHARCTSEKSPLSKQKQAQHNRPLAEAGATAGCRVCQKELETEKEQSRAHDNCCPRKRRPSQRRGKRLEKLETEKECRLDAYWRERKPRHLNKWQLGQRLRETEEDEDSEVELISSSPGRPKCKAPGCEKYKQSYRDGYCASHYTELVLGKKKASPRLPQIPCKSPGCDKWPQSGRDGFCVAHYKGRNEIPDAPEPKAIRMTDEAAQEMEVFALSVMLMQYWNDHPCNRADLLDRVPGEVRSRFREGGFSKWGANWLPVLELGPFDVGPGQVRDTWMDVFNNTQENGRDMSRLVFWYGVKFEDRRQAYSFLPASKIVSFEEGKGKGYAEVPKKIQKKLENSQKLTKTEEQIQRGLSEIVDDMQKEKSERGPVWMAQFKEEFELAEEEAQKGNSKTGDMPTTRGPGRPKKAKGETYEDGVPLKRHLATADEDCMYGAKAGELQQEHFTAKCARAVDGASYVRQAELGKRKSAPDESDSVAALRVELEQERGKVRRLKKMNSEMSVDLEEVRGDLDIAKETIEQQLLATDRWQGRFDELARRAESGPVNGIVIAELRSRSLANAPPPTLGVSFRKIKVGRISGFPVVVKQGRGRHEAILVGCDDDPKRFIAQHSGQEVKIRWKIAGYDDFVLANDVRLLSGNTVW